MFCPKCGNRITEEGKFCPKCGNEIRVESVKQEKNFPYDIRKIIIALALFLVVGIVVGVFGIPKKTTTNMEYEVHKNDYEDNNCEDDNSYEKALDYSNHAGYPAIIEFANNDTGENAEDWSDYDFEYDMSDEYVKEIYKQKTDITDLYGTWVTADRTFSITFGRDGKVRVADASNLLGVDVFSYREIDENTLGLKAEGMNPVLNLVEIAMAYELSGSNLTIEFLEYRFELVQSN